MPANRQIKNSLTSQLNRITMNFSILLFGAIGLASLILTMIGLGGGLIFSPLFILLGFAKPVAVSSSLFLNGIAAASAAYVYAGKKMVDYNLSLPLIISSSIGAWLGALSESAVDTKLFLYILSAIVFLAALRMIFGGSPGREDRTVLQWQKLLAGSVIGIIIGFIGGLLGIGGGVFIVPLLIYFLGIETKTAAATSIFVVCFSSFAGFATYVSEGVVDWSFILPAALFSFIGGQIGSRIMVEKLRGKTVRRLFGIILILFCIKLLQKSFV